MRYFLTILIVICARVLFAQEPAYIQYGVEDGLPSSLVYCMLQDKKGFMWFGTDKGLARFDGVRFKVYTIKDGLPDSEVLNMFEDSHGRIWLSCFQKKPCYFLDGEFHTAKNDKILRTSETKSGTYTYYDLYPDYVDISIQLLLIHRSSFWARSFLSTDLSVRRRWPSPRSSWWSTRVKGSGRWAS